jgi:hypothetical protein
MAASALDADVTGRPQAWQNVIPSGIFVPQLGQNFITASPSFFSFRGPIPRDRRVTTPRAGGVLPINVNYQLSIVNSPHFLRAGGAFPTPNCL